MLEIPIAVASAALWVDAQAQLRRALGREPAENEVRRFLKWPEKIGEAVLEHAGVFRYGGTTSVAFGGTSFRLQIEKMLDGRVRMVLTDAAYLQEANLSAQEPKAASRG